MLVALAMLAIAIAVTRAIQNWLEDRLMLATSLDAGLQFHLHQRRLCRLHFAVSLALAQIGLGLDKIAIVAGALSVGIGFGLNSIINNFVSGIIVPGNGRCEWRSGRDRRRAGLRAQDQRARGDRDLRPRR